MNRRLLIVLIPLVIAGCSSSDNRSPRPMQSVANPCATDIPLPNPNRPVMCVDDRDLGHLATIPNAALARRDSPMKWYTVSGSGGLAVTFTDEACVKNGTVDCAAGSSCSAKLDGNGNAGTQCKYSIAITRNGTTTSEDPIIIIDTGVFDPANP